MRAVYSISFFEQTIAAASGDYDLWEMDPAADKPIELMAVFIGNKSEVGDAQEEMVSWSISRATGGTFTSGNGTGTTPKPLEVKDQAASGAFETVGATIASTSGTLDRLHQDTFNIRTGLQYIAPPDMRFTCSGVANEALVITMRTALADDATFSGTAYIREL